MKTIGLLGGMSWESTALYYKIINEGVQAQLGGLHSARLVMYSVDFYEIERLQAAGEWRQAAALLADAARALQAAGADFLVLCTNTMHKVAPEISAATSLPLLHIADATAEAVKAAGISKVGLLGTRFTMEQAFYRARLEQQFGIEVLVPDEAGRETVHHIIYQELCLGHIHPASREKYRAVIAGLVARGAEAIVMGCTEITLLIDQQDAAVPLFDTTRLHAEAAVALALA
ncbi:aspartate/glutamate racemase family protein [Mixta tenebrionis]|uniref:Aspartate/glutamate racemase family protein n=1 Tax=Mixta tenebrionis TaxID=2562439 RepID=A0A506V9E9_9GAMM|nr:aspartate/glutamate racemase family protein [Mixta tenebrionis]TPW42347.1 aspartate/glutamate racemase family protein [Mixta tenebrionis]